MFALPWSLTFTALFALTALLCLLHLARSRALGQRAGPLPDPLHHGPVSDAVHLNHLVMSVAMLLMVWRPAGDVGTGVQVVVFALFSGVMLLGLRHLPSRGPRIAVLSHVLLDAARIWMLLAMPALMGHPRPGADDAHAGHHGSPADLAPEALAHATPTWVEGVHLGVVIVSAVLTAGWLVALRGPSHHRVHAICHALMAAGMTLMLLLM